ncbi:hypothetical protein AB1L30_26670 [Bremerella sp. JC817]|uniref:hypothetical protein n=1 Tax=Bremerella sp. JC817 TaxID=3231756 RepID=UPI00345A6F97
MFNYYEYWSGKDPRRQVGSIDVNTQYIAQRSWGVILVKAFAAVIVAGFLFWLLFHFLPLVGWQRIAVAAGGVLIYTGLAFFVVPRPNTDNMGWCGGMINNPFTYTDDCNQWLFCFYAVLGPGRLISGALLDVACELGFAQSDTMPEPDTSFVDYYRTENQYSNDSVSTFDGYESSEHSKPRFILNDDE